ncbi:alanyl-tRNA editing protein [Halosegnis longus]|uniref:Alanyl-tRNA editing protein n=1 Tax=Halosegnis longus TaxID=2216012 RepID=A0AAJ4R9A0_9EURY|nr:MULTISPECIES: alanyl-tRNA editing protein [Halobacteriales]RNJ26577.1 alanyl-tRNA editing protein [Salella cibi]
MTDALYLDSSDTRRFEATVERSLDDRVVLDRTHFYPEGGGQPADHGTLATDDREWTVTDVQKSDTIYHRVTGEPPAEGAVVTGAIDAERRDTLTRYHTAQHLLSAILLDEYDAPTRGNQIYTDYARLDAAYDRFDETDLADIEAQMNAHVEADRGVRWYTLDRETAESELDPERTRIELLPESITELRIVEIDGEDGIFDRTACAGTHVEQTGDIGAVEITERESAGAGEERIRFEVE